tara:strand:+ start:550 stop:834 length:285 start_codon:yes stop_codon:yes gene_type:complete
MEDFYRYTVLFSCKDEGGVVVDHPLRPFELEIEAKMYLEGYVDAIINHTDEKNPDLVKGMFRIAKIGEENVKEFKKKKSNKPKPKKDDSLKEVS